jgi:hypothetical protein
MSKKTHKSRRNIMKKSVIMTLAMTVILIPVALPGVWTDDFEGKTLANEWEFRDRREKVTKTEVKGGFLSMTNPKGKWGHMTADKAMLERDVPTSSQNLTVSGVFSSEPEKPVDAWIGMFIFGEEQMDFACLLYGGEANQPQKALIGSMVQGAWQDKGHFNTGFDVPLHLKLEKEKDVFTGYMKQKEGDNWKQIGNKTWTHKIKKVKKVGLGIMNNWGGKTVVVLVDSFSLEGEGVKPMAVDSTKKLATTWAGLKR